MVDIGFIWIRKGWGLGGWRFLSLKCFCLFVIFGTCDLMGFDLDLMSWTLTFGFVGLNVDLRGLWHWPCGIWLWPHELWQGKGKVYKEVLRVYAYWLPENGRNLFYLNIGRTLSFFLIGPDPKNILCIYSLIWERLWGTPLELRVMLQPSVVSSGMEFLSATSVSVWPG